MTIIARGVAAVPEGRSFLQSLTVAEYLAIGAYYGPSGGGIRAAAQAFYALFPRLYKRRRQLAWTLSGREQQMLALHVAHGRKLKEHLLRSASCPAAFLSRSDVL